MKDTLECEVCQDEDAFYNGVNYFNQIAIPVNVLVATTENKELINDKGELFYGFKEVL